MTKNRLTELLCNPIIRFIKLHLLFSLPIVFAYYCSAYIYIDLSLPFYVFIALYFAAISNFNSSKELENLNPNRFYETDKHIYVPLSAGSLFFTFYIICLFYIVDEPINKMIIIPPLVLYLLSLITSYLYSGKVDLQFDEFIKNSNITLKNSNEGIIEITSKKELGYLSANGKITNRQVKELFDCFIENQNKEIKKLSVNSSILEVTSKL